MASATIKEDNIAKPTRCKSTKEEYRMIPE